MSRQKDTEILLDLIGECLKLRYNEKNPEASGFIVGQIIKAGFTRENIELTSNDYVDERNTVKKEV